MASLLLHIGDSPGGGWRDGDIMHAHRVYDALRVYAEMIIRGRKIDVGSALSTLKEEYYKITKYKNVAVPTEIDLNTWWDIANSLVGLNKSDFEDFPYSKVERKLCLVVPFDRNITEMEKTLWSKKRHNLTEIDIPTGTNVIVGSHTPMFVDWRTDIVNKNLARTKVSDRVALSDDVLNHEVEIKVTGRVSDTVLRSR